MPPAGVDDVGAELLGCVPRIAAVGDAAARRELERHAQVASRGGEHIVEGERLPVALPPAQQIVNVDDHAARRAGVKARDDRLGQWLTVGEEHIVDRLAREPGVAERRIQQLGVEQVGDHDVVGRIADSDRSRQDWIDGTSVSRRLDDRVPGAAGHILRDDPRPSVPRRASPGPSKRTGVNIDQVDASARRHIRHSGRSCALPAPTTATAAPLTR